MSDEPGHKAMLYFLEVLMNSNGPLTISQLAGRFGSRSFTAEMRTAAGGNEVGLKKFLLKYPSLFTVRGNMVSLFDGSKATGEDEESTASSNSSGSTNIPAPRPLPDISAEMEAVQYFQGKLMKKEERWIPIRSLAGHLSQASMAVRNVVGPQLEFQKWLLRHPHIFEVQGELVGLRDGIAAVATPAIPPRRNQDAISAKMSTSAISNYKAPPPPKTPPPQRRLPPRTPPTLRRSHSFSEKRAQAIMAQTSSFDPRPLASLPPSTPGTRRRGLAPITMTANEYNAVRFLKDVLEKNGPMKMESIIIHFSQAAEGIRKTIGWAKPDLEDFVRRNANVFSVDNEMVNVIKNAKLNNVIITGSRPQGGHLSSIRTLSGRKGKVFHVAKLWGIIDLGKHEHVFFDKSIMVHPLDDLQKEYSVGETLYFNAVLAPKTSRAKWRATRVWKEFEVEPSDNDSEFSSTDHTTLNLISPSMSIEDEINQFLPQKEDDELDTLTDKYSDAAPSAAGVVTVWNFRDGDSSPPSNELGSSSVTMVPESYQMSAATLGEMKTASAHIISIPGANLVNGITSDKVLSSSAKKSVEVGCQTVSTGDIIATQLYHESE
ncbi:hypothetical protein LSH36_360g01011 [Paralvinella palmiformis]|uniref:Egal-1 winged helix domain-containing protein n=1 Tax=Paralvinella palmiformis TaxID=53620 RepID=A0AAD9JF24_9ANNE|nr:hypothetical protein LSH36_360g01011 [Paralvinella palmiformis]